MIVIKTVLFDLDNTLLRNPTPEFVAGYVSRINRFFKRRWNIEPGEHLREGVQIMAGPRNIWQTNLEIYWMLLHRILPLTAKGLSEAFTEFYETEYKELRANTSPAPAAETVIDRVRSAGYKIVIATNPVYPEEAIRLRLTWAGLPGDFTYYDFVTTADNMHFTKPSPAYYGEILARCGLEPDEAVMVGDEPVYDIQAAGIVGLHTRHLNWETLGQFLDDLPCLPEWMPPAITSQSIVPQWLGNLGSIFGVVADMPPRFWDQHPFPDEWSPAEILCHLTEYERSIHRPRLERIAVEPDPFVTQPNDPPPPSDYPLFRSAHALLPYVFLKERQNTIDFIESVTPATWDRTARHSIFGPTTFLEMAYFTAQHDRLHIRQLCQTIGGCE